MSTGWTLFLLLVIAVAVAGVIYYYRFRHRVYSAADVQFQGAVKSIMDGHYPNLSGFLVKLPDVSVSKPPAATGAGSVSDHDDTEPTVPSQRPPASALNNQDNEITQVSAMAGKTDLPAKEAAEEEASGSGEAPPSSPQSGPITDGGAIPVPEHIFREYDIRGLVESELSPILVRRIGRAIGSEIRQRGRKHALIARDNRASGEKLIRDLAKGMLSSGVNLTNLGVVPTPVMYYSLLDRHMEDGVMLTGSHNDYRFNGMKIVIDGMPLRKEGLNKLRDRVISGDYQYGRGRLETVAPFSDYAQKLLDKFSGDKLPFHIAVDCANGVASAYIPFIMRKLGCQVTELACGMAPEDTSQAPDPTDPANLTELIKCIRQSEGKIDFGMAYDGDGDRLVVVDGKGNIVWPDRVMMLFAEDVLKKNPGATIVYDVKCSSHLHSWIEKRGGKPIMWKTGHSLIRNKMREVNAALAGEMSGHIFFKDDWYGFDDAIYASCRLARLLAGAGQSPTAILSALPGQTGSPEYRIPLAGEGRAQAIMDKARDLCSKTKAHLVDIDGLRLEYPDRWGLLRPSNTTPVLVCRFEGDNAEALASVQKEFKDMLREIDPSLSVPF